MGESKLERILVEGLTFPSSAARMGFLIVRHDALVASLSKQRMAFLSIHSKILTGGFLVSQPEFGFESKHEH